MGFLIGSNIIKFLMGPAGKILLLVVAFLGWTLYQRADATSDCEAAELIEELAEVNRQMELAQVIADQARNRANETEAEMVELGRENADLKKSIESGALASCPIPDDVRERLLRIK